MSESAKRLLELRDEFAAMKNEGKLFNASRIQIDAKTELPRDLTAGWGTFLGKRATFGHSAFRLSLPAKRVQHFCFFGEEELLQSFTGLAALTAMQMPIALLPRISPSPRDREPTYDRDQWMMLLYWLAHQHPEVLPVNRDLRRNSENTIDGVDQGYFDPLRFIAYFGDEDATVSTNISATQVRSYTQNSRYLYCGLTLDVCQSSIQAIDFFASNGLAIFQPRFPTEICDVDNVKIKEPCIAKDKDANSSHGIGDGEGYLQIRFDRERNIVSRVGITDPQGKPVTAELTPIHARLFLPLFQAGGGTVSHDALFRAWNDTVNVQSIDNLYTEKNRLNERLAKLNLKVKSERNMGYRLLPKTLIQNKFSIRNDR